MGEYNPCKQYEELISWYMDGELKPKKAREVESHLQGCFSCSELYKGFLDNSQMFKATVQKSGDRHAVTRQVLERIVSQVGFDGHIIERENYAMAVYGQTLVKNDTFGVLYILSCKDTISLANGPIYCLNRQKITTLPAGVKTKVQRLDKRIKDYLDKKKK